MVECSPWTTSLSDGQSGSRSLVTSIRCVIDLTSVRYANRSRALGGCNGYCQYSGNLWHTILAALLPKHCLHLLGWRHCQHGIRHAAFLHVYFNADAVVSRGEQIPKHRKRILPAFHVQPKSCKKNLGVRMFCIVQQNDRVTTLT